MKLPRRLVAVAAALSATALVVTGCSSSAAEESPYGAPVDGSTVTSGLDGVSDDDRRFLEELYQAAQESGQTTVNLYSAYAPADPNSGLGVALRAFEATFPGITVQSTLLSGAELFSRIDGEVASGNRQGDLLLNGPSNIGHFVKEGRLQPFDPPTARDLPAEFKQPDGLYTVPFQSLFGLVYNTDLVAEDEVPTSLDEVLDPKWAGKVTFAQPNSYGPPDYSITTLHESGAIDEATLQRIADFVPLEDRNAGAPGAVQSVAEGRYALAIWGPSQVAATLASAGAPIAVGSIPDIWVLNGPGLGLLEDAPAEDAAKLLATWLYTPTAQKLIAEGSFNYGTVPGSPAPPGFPEVSGYDRLTIPASEFDAKIADYRPTTEAVFGPAL
ncbi:extracellular solute-binding protein [Rhodococcus rhodochrous]|uniref:ABC transporter substrate-binding protein n=1 Tax=Rhodococcus rhodochrous TaxID=1829 RepID=UPI001E5B90A1|nr:extracellular solute-binding protein [Rhodococcus rhodochrous]MCB8914063.1 extracellular solute-binding protein [Rhodococcus rhodochrous]